MSKMQKWIDLRDKQSGAKLKLDQVNGDRFLFIIGMSKSSPKWTRAIDELGFIASSNHKFLIRLVQADERIKVATYQKIWPDAIYAEMESEKIGLNLGGASRTQNQRTPEERDIANELSNSRRIGRNSDGDEVYEGSAGRFIYRGDKGLVPETRSLRGSMFLRSHDAESLDECADGFVRSMMMNEVMRADDLDRFTQAVTGRSGSQITIEDLDISHEVIDAAVTRTLAREYETANDAYGDSVRLYEYMPAYRGTTRGKGAMPTPLAVIAQRLLGDTSGKTVILPNAFDGAGYSFLPKGTLIRAFRGKKDISARAKGMSREGVEWGAEFHPAIESNADAMLFNADQSLANDGSRGDYKDALVAIRSLAPDARAVLVLTGDNPLQPGVIAPESKNFFNALYSRFQIEDAFEVSRELTKVVGTNATLRVISLKNRAPGVGENGEITRAPTIIPACHSWDEVKSRVDESLAKAAIREAESDGIDLKTTADENLLQRPYIAFSKIGETTTMVPKELQQPLQAFMSDLESLYGSVDNFVEKELGFGGENTLASRFSPEQVDALGTMIHRMKRGRGNILGDETGIGKGRCLAGLSTWALKQDHPVVFITDRANLFSDFARDLRDIGEWGRVRPFVMNSDGQIVDNIGEAGVLAEGIKSAEMKRVLESNIPLEEIGCNVIFATYSQISGVDSEKAIWLKNQLKNALLIVDEAHVAAGSDSNISNQISEMTSIAWGVQYSSATWAKSSANLHIFARAFPESVNVGTLSKTMKRGGEAFSEIFSSMLAREGALIRREHDLSKLEFSVEIDPNNTERNNIVADRIAEIMSALAFTAGSLKRIVTRMSDVNVSVLRQAREVRTTAQSAKIFKSRFGTGSMLYQVNRRVNAALNVDNAVRLAIEGIEAGRKPVIVFEDTGESFIKQALEMQAITMPDGTRVLPKTLHPPTIKDLLRRMVDTLQTVRVEEVHVDDLDELDVRSEVEDIEPVEEATLVDRVPGVADPVVLLPAPEVEEGIVIADAANAVDTLLIGRNEEAPKLKTAKRKFKVVPFWEIERLSESDRKIFEEGVTEIFRLIDSLPNIPLNAPDEIYRRLTSVITTNSDMIRVGELSGRSFTLEAVDEKGTLSRIIPRIKSKTQVNATVKAFNGGQLDVLMINRSAATGISLHASPRFADRRRRQLIEMQIPENPTDRLQLYGRVNRFDQESFPLIQVASTGIFGEVRQIMVQNKKLSEMSANVRSSRDSHALIKDVPDLLNPLGREVCRQFLEDNPEILVRLDLSQADIEPDSQRDLATALTSRVPLLRLDEQRQVYEQLYAMFEDAIVQAELSGNNPLKPNELDVRAKLGPQKLLFGFDHKGVGSSFDGAVFAQRLDWTEDVRPMALDTILEVIKNNREKMIETGKAIVAGHSDAGVVIVDISALAKRAAMQLEGRARLSIAGTEFKTSDEAMLSMKPNPVRRGLARAKWVAENLPKLTPGRIISMPSGESGLLRRNAVILEILPPADKRESQLAQWRVLTVSPGEARPVSTTLNALIGRLIADTTHEDTRNTTNSVGTTLDFAALSRLEIGGDMIELHEASKEDRRQMSTSWIYRGFADRYVGQRSRKALVLTGNMYLASEWAAQTKAGTGVIFTDDHGLRHRGIILKDTFKPEWLKYLPARLWMPGMIDRFVTKLNNEEIPTRDGMYTMYGSFDGAWKATESSLTSTKKDQILMIPGKGLMMHIGKDSRKRVNTMLRQAQRTIKEELYPGVRIRPQDDPGHVLIKDSKSVSAQISRQNGRIGIDDDAGIISRKESEYLVMSADTPEKMSRAFQMLRRGPGLELFVPPAMGSVSNEIGRLANACMRDYYVERLRDDARDDPVRLAKLEDVLLAEFGIDDRAGDLESELMSIRAFNPADAFDGQGEINFATGELVSNHEDEITVEPVHVLDDLDDLDVGVNQNEVQRPRPDRMTA